MNLRTFLLCCVLTLTAGWSARAGLIGLYTFDDSGNPFNDSSGAGNHIVDSAATDPVYGSTLGFGGTGAYDYSVDRLRVPIDVNPTVRPQMTWGAWVRTDSVTSGLRKVLGHDNGAWDRTIGLDNRNTNAGGGSIAGPFRYTGFTGLAASGPVEGTLPPLNTSTWSFIAASYNQAIGSMTFYMDQDASTTADPLVAVTEPASFGAGVAGFFGIGGISPAGTGEAWDGVIDQVFVYDEVLTPEKVHRIRTRGLPELQGTYSEPHIEVVRTLPLLFGDIPFDSVPPAVTRSVTVKNTGTSATLTVNPPTITGVNAGNFTILSAPTSLAPGTQDDIVISLNTGGINASHTATLEITSNDLDSPTISVPLNASVFNRLLGLYTFDNSANPQQDESTHLNHITGTAGTDPAWNDTAGFGGTGAYDFSGDRLTVPININPGVMPKMTWGAWVRTDTLVANQYKVLGHDDGAWDRTIGLDSRNPVSFRYTTFTGIANGSGPLEGTPGPVNTTDWAFIAAIYDQTTLSTTMYVDIDAATTADPLVAVTELAGFGGGASTMAIGGISPANNTEAWDGAIDQVFIYKDVLTPAKITAIRDRGLLELRNVPIGDPNIALTPANPFGNLTALGPGPGPVVRQVRISNTGTTQNLIVSAIEPIGAHLALYSVTPPLPGPIAPGSFADVEVVFTPPAAGGSFTAELRVSSNDEDMPLATISLNATVMTDPNIEVSAASPVFGRLTFNDVPALIQRSVTVRNTGVAGTLTVNAPTITGTDAASYSIVSAPATLPPGTEGDIIISLAPGAAGNFAASLGITSSDADSPGYNISLNAGIVVVPAAALAAFYSFDDSGAPLRDDSGNGLDIADLAGTDPLWGASTGFNNSGAFAFSMDRLIVPLNVNPGAMPQMSWGAWVRTNTVAPALYKFMGHDNGAWDRTLGLDNRNGDFRYTTFTGAGPMPETPGPVNTTDWAFIAATYDQTAAVTTLYADINASSTAEPLFKREEAGTFNDGFPTFAIGDLRPDIISEPWDGAIDNVFVYAGILTDVQMKNIRDQGKAAIVGADDFFVTSWLVNPTGTVTLTWNSKPGATYTLRYSTDLAGTVDAWADENDDIASGGDTTTYTTAASFSSQRRVFFSVERN
jgi:hypothetical protein